LALARQKTEETGANEAWLVDENGFVTEGAACNAWIVTADDDIIPRQAESGILRGITRTALRPGLVAKRLRRLFHDWAEMSSRRSLLRERQ
jgi:branched-subunit amino acid aminotransferase/4-amino-4-deoxychorismate lyase